MQVNIGQMMRGLLGETKAAEGKQLELRSGQVVRGVVMQVSDDGQEALLNINGVQVRAKIEAPLTPGQTTWLQVQPESMNGLIVMKPLELSPYFPVAEHSLAELLKSFGLPDQKWARDLVQQMQMNGIALTKQNIDALKPIAAQQPQGIADGEWFQAAAVALKRGLPLTQETVRALHQALFGKPLHQLLTALQTALSEAAAASGGGSRDTAALLQPGASVPPQAGEAAPAPAPRGGQAAPLAAGAGAAQGANAPAVTAAGARATATPQLLAQAAAALQELAAALPHAAETALPARGGAPGGAAGMAAAPDAAARAAQQPVSPQPPAAAAEQQAAPAPAPQAAAATNAAAAQPDQASPWIGRMLKLLGVEHEQLAWKQIDGSASKASIQPQPQAMSHTPAAAAARESAAEPFKADVQTQTPLPNINAMPTATSGAAIHDSLKSVLLQLAQAEDAPPALRETAQQIVQQITGQQLLMTGDRAAHFAHVSLFIPFQDADGGQTATVHIQARTSKRGELDANNCRLWFDLDMHTLGRTIADVHVVDKIVSLKLHNDNPWLGPLVEEHRLEIAQSLEGAGYQLLSLATAPVPHTPHAEEAQAADPPFVLQSKAAAYSPPSYKGVDVRV
ncbi:hypothetical protein [Paenibacillus sp. MSJ-34]|uniref:hypothetical protein n=1 Tax=Paenibacillus sp. MSJ-34 TaxID=2841529 RepID=UPI00209C76FF|nr:hypothetical protein [Paenibacillus sp. MSJ-34]